MMIAPCRTMAVAALIGALAIAPCVPGRALAQDGTIAIPADKHHRFLEGSNVTFQMTGARLRGRGASLALSVLNYFGTQKQITDGLRSQEATVRRMLRETGLPGVLVFIEHQTSMTDVKINTLVGGKPTVVGPGLTQVDTWQGYTSRGADAFHPRPSDGYRRNEEASYFLWAKEVGGNIEYGMTIPATSILNEARRNLSDFRLRQQFIEQYDSEVLATMVTSIEQNAAEKPLKEKARILLQERDKAIEERAKVDVELKEALERQAKAQKNAAIFDTLATILTLAQLGYSLAADFPDKADALAQAQSAGEMKSILAGVMDDARKNGDAVLGKIQVIEDRQRKLRIEQLRIIRERKLRPEVVPGVLP